MRVATGMTGGKALVVLKSCPGMDFFSEPDAGPCRSNGESWGGYLFFVSGADFIRLDTSGSATIIGTLDTSSGRCIMAGGRDYLVVVDGTYGYAYDTTNGTIYRLDGVSTGTTTSTSSGKLIDTGATFQTDGVTKGMQVFNTTDSTTALVSSVDSETQLTLSSDIFTIGESYEVGDYDFPSNPTHVTINNGFFIVNKGGTDEFYINTTSENPLNWNPLDFATAEAQPDNILSHTTIDKDVYFVGADTTQIYTYSGNTDFPYDPYPSTLSYGTISAYSLAASKAGLFWLATMKGGDVAVVFVQGFQVKEIHEDIMEDLNGFTTLSDAIGWAYNWDGDTIYCLTFPTESKTFEYSLASNTWTERVSNGITRHKGNGIGYLEGAGHIVGSYNSGRFWKYNASTYTEDGVALERYRVTQFIHQNMNILTYDEFAIDMETGVGLVSGTGSDPQVALSYSDDDGATFSDPIYADMGQIGQTSTRCFWAELGDDYGKGRTFKIRCNEPVAFTVIAGFAMIRAGGW